MLVYCTTVWLKSSPEQVLSVIAGWLNRKTGSTFHASDLAVKGPGRLSDGQMERFVADSDFPKLYCVRYMHGDKEVRGRQWITEIGLRQEKVDGQIECSVLLRTDEISTLVETLIEPSVPGVVHQLISECSPVNPTAGLRIAILDDNKAAEALWYEIERPERGPIALVSPTESGEYLVDIDRLKFQLEGLADIVKIPVGADTFRFQEILTSQFIAYRGAVLIIFPAMRGKQFYPTKRFMPDELQLEKLMGQGPERVILSYITHKTNFPNSRRHVSPDKVSTLLRERDIRKLRKTAAETGDWVGIAEELEKDKRGQSERIEELEQRMQQLEQDNLQLEADKEALQYNLKAAKRTQGRSEDGNVLESVRVMLTEKSELLTPECSLFFITKLFPDRVEALETALKSAVKSESFKYKKDVFELLWNLANDYWRALDEGKGDAQARSIFGSAYAAKESETASGNKRARGLRTFSYNGQEIIMEKHLKIGVNPSPVETIRIHFGWIPEDRKIVIGYCGPHLDHK